MCPERRGKSSQEALCICEVGVMAEVSFRTRTSAWEESRTKRGGERSSDVFVYVCSSLLHTCIHLCTCSPVCIAVYLGILVQ